MKISAIIRSHPKDVDLVETVGRILGITIPIVDEIPADGYVIVTRHPESELGSEVARRVVWVGADRNGLMGWMEQHGFAAAVANYRFLMWLNRGSGSEPSWGIVGRKDLAATMDATVLDRPFIPTDRYGLFDGERYPDLPSWIAAYLVAHDKAYGAS